MSSQPLRLSGACVLVLLCTLCGGAFADSQLERPGHPRALSRSGIEHKAVPTLRGLEGEASIEAGEEEFKEEELAEGAEEGEEEGEEEEEFGKADIQVAFMLLGSVAFVMVLLMLVNYPDDDVRRYAWRIISATMSIFTAVLFFQGNNQLLEAGLETYMKDLNELSVCAIHFCHCLLYLCLLGASIVVISGSADPNDKADLEEEKWVVGDAMLAENERMIDPSEVRAYKRDQHTTARKSYYEDKFGMEVQVHKKKYELERRKKMMRCVATLLAHMGGFAAIRAGGSLQHYETFKASPTMAMVSVLLTAMFLLVVFVLTGMLRTVSNKRRGASTTKGMRAKLTKEEVLDSENDVLSLALSFLTIQAVRFTITGELPNEEGHEEPPLEEVHLKWILALMAVGVGFALLAIAMVFVIATVGGEEEEEETFNTEKGMTKEEMLERVLYICMNACSMCFAWCLFWGTKWECIRQPFIDVETLFGTVVMALVLSFLTCVVVIFLDQIEDQMKAKTGANSKVGPMAIQSVITSFGILVGFAWEHCFDEGVAAVASKSDNPVVMKFVLGVVCVSLLAVPWQKYILSKAMQLEELQKIRQEAAKAQSGEEDKPSSSAHTPPEQQPLTDASNGTAGSSSK